MDKRPADRPFKLVNSILALRQDDNAQAINRLYASRVHHIAYGKVDHLGQLTVDGGDVVFCEEGLDLEGLLGTEALLGCGQVRAGQ